MHYRYIHDLNLHSSHKGKRADNNLGNITSNSTYPLLPKSFDNNVGTRLFYIRSNKNMTLVELSEKTGICWQALSNIERNVCCAKLQTLATLSTTLDIPLRWLGCFEDLPETTLAEKIYKARMLHGFTRKQAANYLHCNAKSIFNWEHSRVLPLKDNDSFDKFLSILNSTDLPMV